MSDLELIDAVAQTGEDSHEIRRRGFVLTGPDDSGPEPECLLDVMLVDLPESGTVDWDALGFGCREPFFTSTLKARKKAKTTRSRRPERRDLLLTGSKIPATPSSDGRGVWWRCPSLAAPTPVAFPRISNISRWR